MLSGVGFIFCGVIYNESVFAIDLKNHFEYMLNISNMNIICIWKPELFQSIDNFLKMILLLF